MSRSLALLVAGLVACGGGSNGPDVDEALTSLALVSVNPGTIVPGTRIVIEGRSFVEEPWGQSYLELDGTLDGQPVDALLPATFVESVYLGLTTSHRARLGNGTEIVSRVVSSTLPAHEPGAPVSVSWPEDGARLHID